MSDEKFHRRLDEIDTGSSSGMFQKLIGDPDPLDEPNDALLIAQGVNGHVILSESRIRITRENVALLYRIPHFGRGEKDIRLENITGIELKRSGKLTRLGYIQFGQAGYTNKGGISILSSRGIPLPIPVPGSLVDQNTVMFEEDRFEEFRQLRDRIEELNNTVTK